MEELETILDFIFLFLSKSIEFCHLLADIVAYAEFALTGYNFVVLLVFKFLLAKWVVANYLPTCLFVLLYLQQRNYFWTEAALNIERVDYFFNNAGGAANFDVSVTHGTISVQYEPIFNA